MPAVDVNETITRIRECKTRFTAYNASKIASLHASLGSPELINLFHYIPFLFTVNQPEFPGYVKEIKIPHGINNYTISQNLLAQIRITNPSFMAQKTTVEDPVIKLFALIGSAGTIAFTPDSDMDFWICGSFSLMDQESLTLLRRKCSIIEKWVMDHHKKEIHFFLNDIDRIKMNVYDEDGEYGLSGSSLGQMLKEEFYRSSIIINDTVPFWWVVPPDCSDEEYSHRLSLIAGSSLEKEFVDLGNIAGIRKGDFLIAALFQIIKSLGNPFKSIIKLGLLEKYIHDDRTNPFISNLIKKNIHEGKTEKSGTDAYCIMFDQVYDYYRGFANDMTATNVIKTSFYLKVDPRLSKNEKRSGESEFREIMLKYVKNWGWDNDTISHVDDFENWDIESTGKMMNNAKKVILRGYKDILAAIGPEVDEGSIDREQLLAINRKIYSHFKPEQNKIDNTLNFKKYPPEKLLSLDYVRDAKGNETWYLNKRVIMDERAVKILINKSSYLLTLIVWISLNGLYQKDYTRLEIDQGLYHLDANYIRDLIAELSSVFSVKGLHLQNSYFLREPFPVMSYIIINPFSKYSKAADEIFFLYHNSWGETRFEVYNGEKYLPEILSRIINGILITGMNDINALHVAASGTYSTSKDFAALKSTMKNLLGFFSGNKAQVKQRFLTLIAGRFTIFSNTIKPGGPPSVSYSLFNSVLQMLYSISYNRGLLNRNHADDVIPELQYLSEILAYGSDDSVKIFSMEGKRYSMFFVLNERGSLMMFRKQSKYHGLYLAGLVSFAESVVEQVIKASPDSELARNGGLIRTYRIETDSAGRDIISEYSYAEDVILSRDREKIFPVSLSVHILDSGDVGYSFTLPHGDTSEIFSRGEIESISGELLSLMQDFSEYLFFPTSVDLSGTEIRMYSQYTSFAFSEKNRFELLIEKNLGMI